MKNCAVVFTYRSVRDSDGAVSPTYNSASYLYETEEEAKRDLVEFFRETVRILKEEANIFPECTLLPDNSYARIQYRDGDGTEIDEIFIANVYQ